MSWNKTPINIKEQVIDLKKSGESVPKICDRLSIGKSTVYRILEQVDPGREIRRSFNRINLNQLLNDRFDEVKSLYESGLGSRMICTHLGVSADSKKVLKFLKDKGVEIRKSGGASKYLHLAERSAELYEQGFGDVSISRKLGFSKKTAQYLLDLANVKKRSKRRPSVRGRRERDRLFMSELEYFNRFAGSYYTQYKDLNIPLDDIKQAVMVAALRAAELWKEEGMATFRTYACAWARYAILELVREAVRTRHGNRLLRTIAYNDHKQLLNES